jgi:hypothetical protein
MFICTVKWHALGREEQAKYYEMARRERQLHMQMYPNWSSAQNRTHHEKKRKKKADAKFDGGQPRPLNDYLCLLSYHLLSLPLSLSLISLITLFSLLTRMGCGQSISNITPTLLHIQLLSAPTPNPTPCLNTKDNYGWLSELTWNVGVMLQGTA